jgi:hypothetical protein
MGQPLIELKKRNNPFFTKTCPLLLSALRVYEEERFNQRLALTFPKQVYTIVLYQRGTSKAVFYVIPELETNYSFLIMQ